MNITSVSSANSYNASHGLALKKKMDEAKGMSPEIEALEKMKQRYQDQLKKINESKMSSQEKLEKQKEIQEQIKSIDVQISQIATEEQQKKAEEQVEKKEEEDLKNKVKTEEEQQKDESKHLLEAMTSFSDVRFLNKVRVKIKGDLRCAQGEIEASKARGGVPTDSSIAAKAEAETQLDVVAGKMAGKIEDTLEQTEKAGKVAKGKTIEDKDKDGVEDGKEEEQELLSVTEDGDSDEKKEVLKRIDIKV